MNHKDFEDFLQDKFIRNNPMVLDDDVPDAFSEWLEDIDVNDLIKFADQYAKKIDCSNMTHKKDVPSNSVDFREKAERTVKLWMKDWYELMQFEKDPSMQALALRIEDSIASVASNALMKVTGKTSDGYHKRMKGKE